jgi:hypothetical protein
MGVSAPTPSGIVGANGSLPGQGGLPAGGQLSVCSLCTGAQVGNQYLHTTQEELFSPLVLCPGKEDCRLGDNCPYAHSVQELRWGTSTYTQPKRSCLVL